MAVYTMELYKMIDIYTQQYENLSIAEKIEKARKILFSFNYPIFDEKYRAVFETHFIRRFYMREIGFETEELFKFQLETWLQINMPYFNKLFMSELIKFDPLQNFNFTENFKQKKNKLQDDETSSSSSINSNRNIDNRVGTKVNDNKNFANDTDTDSKGSSFGRDVNSDTPDQRLRLHTEDEGTGIIEYASQIDEHKQNETGFQSVNAHGRERNQMHTVENTDGKETQKQTATQNQTYDSSVDELNDYVRNVAGKNSAVSYSKMLSEYRDTFMRIENDIFKEMNNLFMLIY